MKAGFADCELKQCKRKREHREAAKRRKG